jgi:hypothetical protein
MDIDDHAVAVFARAQAKCALPVERGFDFSALARKFRRVSVVPKKGMPRQPTHACARTKKNAGRGGRERRLFRERVGIAPEKNQFLLRGVLR